LLTIGRCCLVFRGSLDGAVEGLHKLNEISRWLPALKYRSAFKFETIGFSIPSCFSQMLDRRFNV